MRRLTCALSVLALILSLVTALPTLAAEAPDAVIDLALITEQAEEPNLTPADQPLDLGEIDLEKELRLNKVRICEEDEWATCPDPEFGGSCTCVVWRYGDIRCYC